MALVMVRVLIRMVLENDGGYIFHIETPPQLFLIFLGDGSDVRADGDSDDDEAESSFSLTFESPADDDLLLSLSTIPVKH